MRGKFAMELRASLESSNDGIDALATDAPVVTTDEVAVVNAGEPVVETQEVEVAVLPDEVAESVVVDNSDSLEEAIEESDAAAAAVDDNIEQVEELDAAAAGLESILVQLQSMRQGEKVDALTLRATNLAIESYANRVGLGDSLNVSVESFNANLSMEQIKETLSKVWDAILTFLIKVKEAVLSFLKRVFTAVGRLEARGKKLASLKLSGEPKEKSFVVKGLGKRLAIGNSVITDPQKGLEGLIQTAKSCIDWDQNLAATNRKIRDRIEKVSKNPLGTTGEMIGNMFKDVPDITDLGAPKGFTKISGDAWGFKTAVLPGNVQFVGSIQKDAADGKLLIGGREFFFGVKIVKESLPSNVAEETKVDVQSPDRIQKTGKAISALVAAIKQAQFEAGESLKEVKNAHSIWDTKAVILPKAREEAILVIKAYRAMASIQGQLTAKVISHAVRCASAYLELAERSAVQYAKSSNESMGGAEVTSEADDDVVYSEEGIKGAITGFLLGTVATLAPVPFARAMGGAAGKAYREKLKGEILVLSERLAKLRNGNIEEAKKEGIRVRKEDLPPLDKWTVAKSAVFGQILPFYGTYQGHQAEELQIKLAEKITELKLEFAKNDLDV